MGLPVATLRTLLDTAFPGANIDVIDLAGDENHYKAVITADAFRDKTRVQQHQMVYAALKGAMGGDLHALALETKIPKGEIKNV